MMVNPGILGRLSKSVECRLGDGLEGIIGPERIVRMDEDDQSLNIYLGTG
jgi:hypothetical protein